MQNKVLAQSFLWMAFGLIITFLTGFEISRHPVIIYNIFGRGWSWVFLIGQLLLVIYLSNRLLKLSETTAKVMFCLYSFATGLTFSSIFISFKLDSIIYVFLIAAFIYAVFGLIGYSTKCNLAKLGNYLLMILVGIIIASFVNLFIFNNTLMLICSIVGVIVFTLITAYDVQKIKNLPYFPNAAIYGALQLYLDFINLFLDLLRLFGRDKN